MVNMLGINLESTLIVLIEDQVTPSLTKTESFFAQTILLGWKDRYYRDGYYPGKIH